MMPYSMSTEEERLRHERSVVMAALDARAGNDLEVRKMYQRIMREYYKEPEFFPAPPPPELPQTPQKPTPVVENWLDSLMFTMYTRGHMETKYIKALVEVFGTMGFLLALIWLIALCW